MTTLLLRRTRVRAACSSTSVRFPISEQSTMGCTMTLLIRRWYAQLNVDEDNVSCHRFHASNSELAYSCESSIRPKYHHFQRTQMMLILDPNLIWSTPWDTRVVPTRFIRTTNRRIECGISYSVLSLLLYASISNDVHVEHWDVHLVCALPSVISGTRFMRLQLCLNSIRLAVWSIDNSAMNHGRYSFLSEEYVSAGSDETENVVT